MSQPCTPTDPLRDLRESLKWLVVASGATAATLVAGLQLSTLSKLPLGPAIAGAAAAAVAIALALSFLFAAAKILAVQRPTANELCDLENNLPRGAQGLRIESPDDPLLCWIYDRRTRFLGASHSVNDVYSDMIAARRALEDLDQGRPSTLCGRTLSPADRGDAEVAFESALGRLLVIEDASHSFRTREQYQRLMFWFPWGAGLFVIAVVAFALMPAFS